MKANPNHRPRGFTIILGFALLGLIAVALVLLTRQTGYEMQRTRSAYDDAQLRQLLLAGAQDTLSHANSWTADRPSPDHWMLELPADLRELGASVSIHVTDASENTRAVDVDARLRNRQEADTLQLSRSDQGWKLVSTPGKQ
jgi:hypothetical protein